MTTPSEVHFAADNLDMLADAAGTVVVFTDGTGALDPAAAAVDSLTGGALGRAVAGDGFRNEAGRTVVFPWPAGMAAERVILAVTGDAPDRAAVRKTGGAIATSLSGTTVTVCAGAFAADAATAEMVWALVVRLYKFRDYKSTKDDGDADDASNRPAITVLSAEPEALARASAPFAALAEGVFFTRDLVHEPANILTTDEFAARLGAMAELGLDVEIMGEPELSALGARALLAVGNGSDCESKMVVMKWMGGPADAAPLALVGKGVVFDTGGISLKPAGGMEEMTMDMGGAGVVAGVMRTLALRKAPINVVGVVGLVENMPDARATRPGDIVKSMKGTMIEIVNTDAEGRLVLADVLTWTQREFKPAAVVDLATLTGAVIVALSKHIAGYFANDDAIASEIAAACVSTGEKGWRLPLDSGYHDQIKSPIADIKNTGGRPGGSCTAAAFLEVFIEKDMPWVHIDIAGVTMPGMASATAPKGASGWGVAMLDEWIRTREAG